MGAHWVRWVQEVNTRQWLFGLVPAMNYCGANFDPWGKQLWQACKWRRAQEHCRTKQASVQVDRCRAFRNCFNIPGVQFNNSDGHCLGMVDHRD